MHYKDIEHVIDCCKRDADFCLKNKKSGFVGLDCCPFETRKKIQSRRKESRMKPIEKALK